MQAYLEETVLDVRHWTPQLFSFTTTRSPSFRFENGQFVMLGLEVDDQPLMRAYSIASPAHEDFLGFFSIKAPNGPLTSRLQKLQPGDRLLVGRKTTGTLLLDYLRPEGRVLYLLSTGTGIAPFVATINDPQTYAGFDRVVLAHGCREVRELSYGEQAVEAACTGALCGAEARRKLLHFPTVTREPFRIQGRVTDLLSQGAMARTLSLPNLDPAFDRVMVCGSPQMVTDSRELLKGLGFSEGAQAHPGEFVVERAFVDS